MSIFDILVGFIFGCIIKYLINFNNEENLVKDESVNIIVEIIDETYYAWMSNINSPDPFDKHEFITQSVDKNKFLENLLKKFNNKNINLISKEKILWPQENMTQT